MSTLIIPALFISVLFTVATYSVVKSRGGRPIGWALGMFVAWPVLAPVVAAKYRNKPMLLNAAVADVLLVVCLLVVTINAHTSRLEKQSVTNLHELSQALFDYADRHGGTLPAKIDDLTPHLRRHPVGSGLPPALISPFSNDTGLVGYQLIVPRPVTTGTGTQNVRIDDLPADALILKDAHAPPNMRIGVYADGSVRSF